MAYADPKLLARRLMDRERQKLWTSARAVESRARMF